MTMSPRAIAQMAQRSDRHEDRGRYSTKSSIKRLFFAASIANLLVLSPFGKAYAADPYDGEWTGAASPTKNGRCKPANVTLTVLDKQAIGQASFDVDKRNINGTVRPDGTLGGTIGFLHLTGQFSEDKFEGVFQSFDCSWKVILKRTSPPARREPTSGKPHPSTPSIRAADGDAIFRHSRQVLGRCASLSSVPAGT